MLFFHSAGVGRTEDRDIDSHRHSSLPSLQREAGGHTKDHHQHEETKNEDGSDSCTYKIRSGADPVDGCVCVGGGGLLV